MTTDRLSLKHPDCPDRLDSATRAAQAGQRTWRYRIGAALLAVVCLGILATARYLRPDARGYGTHEQLGRPACGFLERTGYPCPTCGMTTAFSCVLHGRILLAFATQPAGALGALACMVTAVGGMYYALTARLPGRMAGLVRLVRRRRFWLAGLGLLLAAWLGCCLRVAIQTP